MEKNSRFESQIALNAKALHELSPLVAKISQDNMASHGVLLEESLPAVIQGLNRAIVKSDVLWALGSTVVLGLSEEIAMKAGCGIDIDHIPMMNYIKTRVPRLRAPHIHGVLQDGRRSFVFMTRIKGEPLDRVWKTLDNSQKESIKEQLEIMFSGIRSLTPPPSDEPRALLGGGIPRRCRDARRHVRVAEKPIESMVEFNLFLTTDPNRTETGRLKMIRSFLSSDHKFVMTHGDLHPRNIMVITSNTLPSDAFTPLVKVTGLLDWEMCGYYPDYWEYVKALHTIHPGDGFDDWWNYLPASIGVWPKEYSVDELISRWRG